MGLFVFTATPQGMFGSTVLITNALIADSMPQGILNISMPGIIAHSVAALTTTLITAWIGIAPSVMILDMSLQTVHFLRTPAWASFSMTETLKDFDVVLVVQLFKGGDVTIHGRDLLFSIVHLSPLCPNSLYTFTILVNFLRDTYQYTVW